MSIFKEIKTGVYFSEDIEGVKVELTHPTIEQDIEFKNFIFTIGNEEPYTVLCETLAQQLTIDSKRLTSKEIASTLTDEFITKLAMAIADSKKN